MANDMDREIRTQFAKNEDELFNANERIISGIKLEMITTATDNRKYIQALKNEYKKIETLIKELDRNSKIMNSAI